MECIKTIYKGKENFGKNDKEIYTHLKRSYDTYMDNSLVRFLMTGSGKGGPRGASEWRSWAENILNSSLDNVTIKDAQYVDAQTRTLVAGSKRRTFADEGELRQWLLKAATLPADLFNYHGIGKIHEKMNEADTTKAGRISRLDISLKDLNSKMQDLVSGSIGEGTKLLAGANEKIEIANAKYRVLLDNKNQEPAKVEAARLELGRAREQLSELTSEHGDKSNSAARGLTLVARMLDGTLTRDQVLAKLGKGNTYRALTGAIDKADKITGELLTLAEDSSVKLRDMLQFELEQKFTTAEAREMANEITQIEAVERFYPRRNLIALHQRVDGVIKAQEIIKTGGRDSIIEKINDLISVQRSAHTKARKGGKGLIDYNMVEVLRAYGKEMYDHAHAAEVGHVASKFVHDLTNLDVVRNAQGNPNSAEVKYANSVRKLVMGHMDQIFSKKVSTVADEALNTVSAFQVFSKLTNVSTAITNRLEGVLMYVSHGGILNMGRRRELFEGQKENIAEAERFAQTKFSVGSDLMDIATNSARNKNLREVLSESDKIDGDVIKEMYNVGAVAQMRSLMSKLGGKGLSLIGWERGENANRQEAFRQGAAEAADFVSRKWQDNFLSGNITEFLASEYNLNRDLLKKARGGNAEARIDLFNDFRSKYIVKQGFRAMHQTQFQYSESARNFMDLNAKTSWITMFQHYPRSLASSMAWAMMDVKALHEVGGFTALKGQLTSKQLGKEGSKASRVAINHQLNHVLTLAGVSALRQMIRASSGLVLFNVASHPLAEIMGDLYSYFVDDEPTSKKDKSWELLYGRNQPIRSVTGPFASTVLDAASIPAKEFLHAMDGVGMAMVENGVRDGSMVQYLSDALGAAGLRPNERALTDQGRKNVGSSLDILTENALHSFAMFNKSQGMVNSILSKNPGDISIQALRQLGVRFDWDVINDQRNDAKNDRDLNL